MNKELKRTIKYLKRNRALVIQTIIPVVMFCVLVTIIGIFLTKPNDNISPSNNSFLFENRNPRFKVGFGTKDNPDTSYVRFEAKADTRNPFDEKKSTIWNSFTRAFTSRKGFEFGLSEIRFSETDSEISRKLVDQIGSAIKQMEVKNVKTNTEVIEVGRLLGETDEDNISKKTVLNKDVYPGVDVEYQILEGLGVKEEIIIRNIEEYTANCGSDTECLLPLNEFVFDLRLDEGVSIERYESITKEENTPTYYLLDDNNNYIAHFLPTFAVDYVGSKTYAVDLVINHIEENNYEVVVTMDLDWLFSNDRVFPIRIDPSIVHDTTTEFNTGSDYNTEVNTGPRVELQEQEIYNIDDNVVGYWKLNEASGSGAYILDSSGNGYHGTPTGTTFTEGKFRGGRRIAPSIGEKISIGDISAFEANTFTVDVYFKKEGSCNFNHCSVFSKGSSGSEGYNFAVNGNVLQIRINDGGSGFTQYLNGTTTISDNVWYHAAVVVNSTTNTMKLYLNGKLDASGSFTETINYAGAQVKIGNGNTNDDLWFNGVIDEVRFSNVERTSEEISNYYISKTHGVHTSASIDMGESVDVESMTWIPVGNHTGGGETPYSTTGLVGQWNFNESSGTTAVSGGSCGATCNGTLTNFSNTTGQDVVAGSGWTSDNRRWGSGALMFDGTNDYVNVGSTENLNIYNSPLTLEAWINTNTPGYSVIMQRMENAMGASGYSLELNSDGTISTYYYYYGSGPTLTSNTKVTDGQWHHIVATFSSTEYSLYIDGVLDKKASGGYPTTGSPYALDFNIGKYTEAPGGYFDGVIDTARVYSRALSGTEILSNYQSGNIEMRYRTSNDGSTWSDWYGGTEESIEDFENEYLYDTNDGGLVAYYPMDEEKFEDFNYYDYDTFDIPYPGGNDDWSERNSVDPVISTAASYSGDSSLYMPSGWGRNFEGSLGLETGQTSAGYDTKTYPYMCMAYKIPAGTDVNMLIYVTGTGWRSISVTQPDGALTSYPKVATWQPISADNQWHYNCINLDQQLDSSIGAGSHTITAVIWHTGGGTYSTGPFYIDDFLISADLPTTYDASGNGNTGTIFGEKVVDGKHGNGRSFDGSGDKITVTNPNTAFDAGTISAWVSINNSGTTGEGIVYTGYGLGELEYFGILSLNGAFRADFDDGDNGCGRKSITSSRTDYADSEWHHVAITFTSQGTGHLYVDGVESGSGVSLSGCEAEINPTTDWEIGYMSAGDYLDGMVDEVRIYNTALSASEIHKQWLEGSSNPSTVRTESISNSIEGDKSISIESNGPSVDGSTVGYWKLNESSGTGAYLKDSSLYGNDGTPTGTTFVKDGKVGGARSFNGSSDYITLPSGFSNFNNGFTVELWAKPTSNANYARFIDFGEASGASSNNILFARPATTNNLGLWSGNGSTFVSISAADGIINNEWHHYAGTIDSSGIGRIYRDGELLTSGQLVVPQNASRTYNYIGKSNWADALYEGFMDEVRISNTARSPSEIYESYVLGKDKYISKSINTTDISNNTSLPFWIASDEIGNNMDLMYGNSAYANYEPDENTVGHWRMDDYGDYVMGEAGTVGGLDGTTWGSVSLNSEIYKSQPLVFTTTQTTAGTSDPSSAHVRNVSSSGFQTQHCEYDSWSCDAHNAETNGWLALDLNKVRDTKGMDAGTVNISGNNTVGISFNKSFANTPLVFTEVLTYNNGTANLPINSKVITTSTSGASIELCEQNSIDGCNTGHPTETVAWFAIDPVVAEKNGKWDWGTVSVTDSGWVNISYSFPSTPVLIVETQVQNGAQEDLISEANSVTSTSAQVRYCEPEGTDACDTHAAETVAWLAVLPGELEGNKENSIKDSSGRGNHGTPTGTTYLDKGKIGGARNFNGSSDYISVPYTPILNPATITTEAWIKTSSSSTQTIVTQTGCDYDQSPCSYSPYRFRTEGGYLKAILYNDSSTSVTLTSPMVINDGKWHHVATSFGGGKAKLYVDGKNVAEDSLAGTMSQITNDRFLIGATWNYSAGITSNFSGNIDEVRISNIARTHDEIRQAFEVGRRTHPIKVDFKASLQSSNLITGSGDTSFTISEQDYGTSEHIKNIDVGEKIIVKENVNGTEYIAQGDLATVNTSTGAVTVTSWDSGSTFPSGGFTVNATVFKWQREYVDIRYPLDEDVNSLSRLTFRKKTDVPATFWIDDVKKGLYHGDGVMGSSGEKLLGFEGTGIESSSEDFEDTTFPPSGWTTSGDANWTRTTTDYQRGSASAASGTITHNQSSTLKWEVSLSEPTELSFFWKVSSEGSYDYLVFCLNNDTCTRTSGYNSRISGLVDWTEVIIPLDAGTNSLLWGYFKDGSVSSNADMGWIDNVAIGRADPVKMEGQRSEDLLAEETQLSTEFTPRDFTIYDKMSFWTASEEKGNATSVMYGSSKYANYQADNNTEAHWTLDEREGEGAYLLDSSGNSNNATPEYSGFTRGKVGAARSVGMNENILAPGDYDPNFEVGGGPGADAAVKEVKIQSDGKILIAGVFTTYDGISVRGIARIDSDGTLDHSFNPGTGVDNLSGINDIAIQSDGKIIIVGYFSEYDGVSRGSIARLNSDGTLDTTFDPGSGVGYDIRTVAVQTDGKIWIGGNFGSYDGVSRGRIARLNSNGSLDTTFNPGTGTNGTIQEIEIQSDDKILVGGSFSSYNGSAKNDFFRLNSDGTLDTTFDSSGGIDGSLNSMAIQADGKIVIGGTFTTFNGVTRNRIARINSNGSLDTTFDPVGGPSGSVYSIQIQTDGKILIGGAFYSYNGTSVYYLARVNSDGTLDSAFSTATGYINGYINEIGLQGDGKVVLGGEFTELDHDPPAWLARVNSDGTSDSSTFFPEATNGFDYSVYDIVIQDDGKILVGGAFTEYRGNATYYIVRLNSDGTVDNTFSSPFTPYWNSTADRAEAIAVQDDGKIIVSGGLTVSGSHKYIWRLNSNGTVDSTFDAGYVSSTIVELVIQPDGKILIGGHFDFAGGTSNVTYRRRRISRLNSNGSLDTTFGQADTGADGSVYTVRLLSDGKILIGGIFNNYMGVSREGIARLNSDGSLDTSFDPGTGANNSVYAIDVQSDGKILVGGSFFTFNGSSINRLVRLNTNGSIDTGFDVGIGTSTNTSIGDIKVLDSGKILIAGRFKYYYDYSPGRRMVAMVNSDGTPDTSFQSKFEIEEYVRNITLSGDFAYLGGDFLSIDGKGVGYITKIALDSTTVNTNGGINIGRNLKPTLPITISAWIYPEEIGDDMGIFNTDKVNSIPFNHSGIWMNLDENGNININYGDNTSAGSTGRRTKIGTTVLRPQRWYHVVGVIRGATDMDIYVNGINEGGTYSGTGGTLVNSNRYGAIGMITSPSDGLNNFFNGTIDEVSVSNISRTESEIFEAYHVDRRSKQITYNFKADLQSTNLITDSGDTSFTISEISYGTTNAIENLIVNDQIIVIEGDGTYKAQGNVASVNPSTGAVTVSEWDTNSIFPSGGFTEAASVFKWQKDYISLMKWDRDYQSAITQFSFRKTGVPENDGIVLIDDVQVGEELYLVNTQYIQYQPIFTRWDDSPSLDLYLTEVAINYSSGPTMDQIMRHGKWFNSSGEKQPFWWAGN